MALVQVQAEDFDPRPAPEVGQPMGGKPIRRRELDVAIEVRKKLGRPIAAICNNTTSSVDMLYTYTKEHGWVEDPTVASLCDKIHGSAGSRILGILARAFALPTSEMHSTSFFRWVPDSNPGLDPDFYGRWQPFNPKPSHVYFSDGWVDLDIPGHYEEYQGIIFGPMITVPLELGSQSSLFSDAVNRHFIGRPEEYRRFRQEMGRVLQPHVPNKYELYLISRIRDNGKSTLINAIAQAPAGPRGFSTISQRRLSEDPFALAGLLNKFANVSSDSGQAKNWSNTLLSLTSGPVSLRMMHKLPFSAMLSAKLLNTCNVMQFLDDRAGNMSNRVKVIEMNGAPYDRDARGGDSYLNAATWSDFDTRKAIVAWMFEGLEDLWQNGPANTQAAKKEVEERINEADPERKMYSALIRPDPDGFVSVRDLFDKLYPGQVMDKKAEAKFGGVIKNRMFAMFGLDPIRKTIDNKTTRGYAVSMQESV